MQWQEEQRILMLAKDDLSDLSRLYKDRNLNKPKWVTSYVAKHELGLSREAINMASFKEREGTKKVDGHIYIDMNNFTTQSGDMNAKRMYVLNQIIDEIYFALDKYLSINQMSQLLSVLSGHTITSWNVWLATYTFNRPTERINMFVKYGKQILCTKALVQNFEPKY